MVRDLLSSWAAIVALSACVTAQGLITEIDHADLVVVGRAQPAGGIHDGRWALDVEDVIRGHATKRVAFHVPASLSCHWFPRSGVRALYGLARGESRQAPWLLRQTPAAFMPVDEDSGLLELARRLAATPAPADLAPYLAARILGTDRRLATEAALALLARRPLHPALDAGTRDRLLQRLGTATQDGLLETTLAGLLTEWAHPATPSVLAASLTRNTGPDWPSLVGRSLRILAGERAPAPLLPLLSEEHPPVVRVRTLQALAATRTASGVSAIESVLDEPALLDPALGALIANGTPAATAALVRLATEGTPGETDRIITALTASRTRPARRALTTLATSHPDPLTREKAAQSLPASRRR